MSEIWNDYDIPVPDWMGGDYYDESIFKDYLLGELVWTTKSGEEILVQDMEETHIKNILKMDYSNKENWEIVFNFELKRRKECQKIFISETTAK